MVARAWGGPGLKGGAPGALQWWCREQLDGGGDYRWQLCGAACTCTHTHTNPCETVKSE